MDVVADKSVDFGIIKELRNKGYLVYSILENNAGTSDETVLNIANENACILLTEDKDFGELVHRLNLKHFGILLIRIIDSKRNEKINLVLTSFENHFLEFKNNFSVLSNNGLRIKKSNKTLK